MLPVMTDKAIPEQHCIYPVNKVANSGSVGNLHKIKMADRPGYWYCYLFPGTDRGKNCVCVQ